MDAGWLIYGNTFIYEDEIVNCDAEFHSVFVRSDLNVQTERTTALILIIYGYFLLIGMALTICIGIGMYYAFQSYSAEDRELKAA